jgi:hypothetical protein
VAASLPNEVLSLVAHQVESRIDAILSNLASITPAASNEFALLAAWIPRMPSLEGVPLGVFKAASLAGNLLLDTSLSASASSIQAQIPRLEAEKIQQLQKAVQASLRDLLCSPSASASYVDSRHLSDLIL